MNASGQPAWCDIKKNQHAYILRHEKNIYIYDSWFWKIFLKKEHLHEFHRNFNVPRIYAGLNTLNNVLILA